MKKQSAERFGGGQQFDPDQLPDELFAEQANVVCDSGFNGATVKKLELKADADRVKALVDEAGTAYDDPEQVVNFYYSNSENLKQIKHLPLRSKLLRSSLKVRKLRPLICHTRML